ncbi:hypothetical protein BX600DRAFT_476009 [Xylariales sp. PMI_506]|nr:hypothetical protein BX600DRAFT_476009 [Xylariales sp. PMI_506]
MSSLLSRLLPKSFFAVREHDLCDMQFLPGPSTPSSQSSHRRRGKSRMTSQTIKGNSIDRYKLEDMLYQKFGNDYTLEMSSNRYKLTAEETLTDTEIMACCAY